MIVAATPTGISSGSRNLRVNVIGSAGGAACSEMTGVPAGSIVATAVSGASAASGAAAAG